MGKPLFLQVLKSLLTPCRQEALVDLMAPSAYQGPFLITVTRILGVFKSTAKLKFKSVYSLSANKIIVCDFKKSKSSLATLQSCFRLYSAFSGIWTSPAGSSFTLTICPRNLVGAVRILHKYQRRDLSGRSSKNSATRYYDVLGVTPSATQHQIKAAYYNKSKLHHPDVSKSPRSHAIFAEISEAYEILSNPQKRRMYDKGIYTRAGSFKNAEEIKTKPPTFERGKHSPPHKLYNFDEHYRQHYNEIRERRAKEYKEFVNYQQKMLESRHRGRAENSYGHSNPNESFLLFIFTLAIWAMVIGFKDN
ncbi:Dnaj subfamily c member [Plakobranchus ocellatus]|uniref:Dnaj subfamily c member n=1 Tax=Plakobranchus ocellatus TaxID=259542 RepID=A0AAV3Y5N2_9GAST|nr:Dnaj subfamily c member [Plakobranchus ocellatus]